MVYGICQVLLIGVTRTSTNFLSLGLPFTFPTTFYFFSEEDSFILYTGSHIDQIGFEILLPFKKNFKKLFSSTIHPNPQPSLPPLFPVPPLPLLFLRFTVPLFLFRKEQASQQCQLNTA